MVDFDVTVRLEVSGDVNSSDYTLSQPMATISAGDLLTTFTINTIDDDAVEGNEFVGLNLSIVSSAFRVDVGGGGMANSHWWIMSRPYRLTRCQSK